MKHSVIALCTLCFSLYLSPCVEKSPVIEKNPPVKLGKLFADEEILELEILGPIRTIINDRGSKRKYHPATLVYFDQVKNKKISLTIKLRTRGHFRKNPRICKFPPLNVKFSGPELPGTLFEDQKTLKLVTHCHSGNPKYQQYVFAEYLVYKMYNLFTSRSLAVRLAHITYLDTKKNKKLCTQYGFFIETVKKMAQRNGFKHYKFQKNEKNYTLELTQRSMLEVFQFIIGNTDWSKYGDHNIIFLSRGSNRFMVCVPYDFDLCGIVNTCYGTPSETSGILSFQDRIFEGYCRSKREFEQIFDIFREKREKITSLYEDFPLISEKYKKYALKYLDKSYKIINTPRLVKKYFLDRCKKRGKRKKFR